MNLNQGEVPTFKIERKTMKGSMKTLDFREDFQEIVADVSPLARVFVEHPNLILLTGRAALEIQTEHPEVDAPSVVTPLHKRNIGRIGTTGDFLHGVELDEVKFTKKYGGSRKTIVSIGVIAVSDRIEQERMILSTILSEVAGSQIEVPPVDLTLKLATIKDADEAAIAAINSHIINFAPPYVDLYDIKVRPDTVYVD